MKVLRLYLIICGLLIAGCSSNPNDNDLKKASAQIAHGIVNGDTVDTSTDFNSKFVVGIYSELLDDKLKPISKEICTGVIVSYEVILTAAHCIPYGAEVYVTFSNELIDSNKSSNNVLKATNVIYHEDWLIDSKVGVNDLALIKLNHQIPENYSPINIPRVSLLEESMHVAVYGFGTYIGTRNKKDAAQKYGAGKLRKAQLQIGTAKQTGTFFEIKPNETQSVCDGDSGGPAIMSDGFNSYLLGIASYSTHIMNAEQKEYFVKVRGNLSKFVEKYPTYNKCAGSSYYMNISNFYDWIHFNLTNF